MKKIVINTCFGGYSVSPSVYERVAELNGEKCYFFTSDLRTGIRKQISKEEAEKAFLFIVYTVHNPNDFNINERGKDGTFKEANDNHKKISLDKYIDDRENLTLIKAIEELGKKANTRVSDLKIVEIPDNIEYTIEEYDGIEHIAEKHRTWY